MSLKTILSGLFDLYNSKFNALNSSKAEDSEVLHKTGPETKDGDLTLNDGFKVNGNSELKAAYTTSADLNMQRIVFPQGGQKYFSGTGALRITVPKSTDIVDFTIVLNLHSLNNYDDTRAVISGRSNSITWAWQSAMVITNQPEDYTVRYAIGPNGESYIYVGELTKYWANITANIESVFINSYSNNVARFSLTGWDFAIVQAFDTISATVQNTFPYGDWTKLKGKPNNLALLTDIPSLSGYALESWVLQKIADLVASSPAALDTLNEIAAALGDDPNFSATILNLLAGKLSNAYLQQQEVSNPDNADNAGISVNFIDGSVFPGTNHALLTLNYSNQWSVQIAGDWRTNDLYVRTQESGTWKTPVKLWTEKHFLQSDIDSWNAKKDGFTVLPVSEGGTGKTSIGEGKVLVGNASGGFDEVGLAAVLMAEKSFDDSEILTSTAYTMIPAPGAGKYVDVVRVEAYYNFKTVNYDQGSFQIKHDGEANGFFNRKYDEYTAKKVTSATVEHPTNLPENKAVVFQNDPPPNGVPTVGDSGFTFRLYYRIEEF